ncbi:Keratin, type I cytoskeletal 18 [Plecturocebus cupreus]
MQSTKVGAAEMTFMELRHTAHFLEMDLDSMRNLKVKLEAEIATYRRLLEDGEDFSLGDALDSFNSMQSIQKTTIRQIVDGKVVSETHDTKVLRH